MKKIIFSLVFTSILSSVHAGNMGSASTEIQSLIHAFGSVEGDYSWYTKSNLFMNGHYGDASHKGWGGRGALGLSFMHSDVLSYTTEMGWGYYARSSWNLPASGFSGTSTYYGFDILGGADYRYRQIDLFAKAGAMFINRRITTNTNLGLNVPGGIVSGNEEQKISQTEFLPEIKVGTIYNVTDHIGISLAYMHLFGADSLSHHIDKSTSSTHISSSSNSNLMFPSFNTIMLGLNYKFS